MNPIPGVNETTNWAPDENSTGKTCRVIDINLTSASYGKWFHENCLDQVQQNLELISKFFNEF